jgi:integrase
MSGKRDACLLALLFGCGLRRAEVCVLTIEHLITGTIANLKGKGERLRTITIPSWVSVGVTAWIMSAKIATGPLMRSFHPDGTINGSLTPSGVYKILEGYAQRLGVSLAPHDCRRTFARLSRDGGASLECVQKTLGHSNQATTERYIQSTEAADAGEYIKLG